MSSYSNLETAIAQLDSLLSQISPDHQSYNSYILAVNTAVKALKAMQLLNIKKQKLVLYKKVKKDQKNDAN